MGTAIRSVGARDRGMKRFITKDQGNVSVMEISSGVGRYLAILGSQNS